MLRSKVLAGSVVAGLVSLGGGVALNASCSPSGVVTDGGTDAPVCNPDSGVDPLAGCACDTTKPGPNDCYTGPLGTQGKGVCQTGKRTCNPDGTYSACVGEVTPSPEICNYADDDCNGIVDDVASIVDAATLFNCNSPACLPNFDDAGITCWGPDLGICGAGTLACQGGPKGGTPNGCNEFLHAGAPEVCNGLDDDCNGLIDDGLTAEGPCTVNDGTLWANIQPDADLSNIGKLADGGTPKTVLGQCLAGNLACVPGDCVTSGPNAGRVCNDAGDQCFPSLPVAETCNGYDDNCNGVADEGTCLAEKSLGYMYCCSYQSGSTRYGFCNNSYLGDGGGGDFYTCNYGW
jgi:hypothetical protein